MPELKRNFLKGRMNKDLEERILPDGEYRHALNVEVGTSEGGDDSGSPTNVGSLQTIMGNERLSTIPFNDGVCVGSIADEKNDMLYWFVSTSTTDLIVRYDQVANSIEPVLVDAYSSSGNPRALNFRPGVMITGINIIEDLLFWTDNFSEPKKINIPKSVEGSTNYTTHTDYVIEDPNNPGTLLNTNIPIQEKHITVIKENPVLAPVLEMKNTSFTSRVIEGTISGSPSGDFTDAGEPLTLGDIKTNVTMSGSPDFEFGDILLLTCVGCSPEKSIRVKVVGVIVPQVEFDLEIIAIHSMTLSTDTNWDVLLEQRESFFDFKFPRFAIRYKYDDGEYSAFGPFSEVAFLPGEYDYHPKKGFNLGMVNQVRHLAIKDFVPEEDLLPDGVAAIDILYKESNSPNIYTVKTVTPADIEWNTYRDPLLLNPLSQTVHDPARTNTKGFLEIESEMIHAILPSNQSLRPWDNVPRKALAQEVTGNRVVYGNYLQNYNVHSAGLEVGVEEQLVEGYLPEEILPEEYNMYSPAKSVKSLRTYQLGVVFRDKYGRETPVFTGTTNKTDDPPSVYVEKQYAPKQNTLTARLTEPPPPFAETFKFFVKETSNEYYNLAMDRWYDAKDDNIWLSFPSSERNKVDIETFLVLKKARDNSDFVPDPARYKILAIENEAPMFVKTEKQSHGTISDNATRTFFGDSGGAGFPLENYLFIYVAQSPWQTNKWEDTLADATNPLWVRMKNNSTISQWYRISSISHDTNVNCYKINLKKPLGVDIAFTSTNDSYLTRVPDLVLEIMEEKVVDKPEFEGRFFVKVHKDITLMNNIVKSTTNQDLWVVKMAKSVQYCSLENPRKPNPNHPPTVNQHLGYHNAANGTHEYQEPGDWGLFACAYQPSGTGGTGPGFANGFDYCGAGATFCVQGRQGIAYPSFFCSRDYNAFGYVNQDANTTNGRLQRRYLYMDGDYLGAVGGGQSPSHNARAYWGKFRQYSSGWFIDNWVGIEHSGGWKDCDPQSGGGDDMDSFPTFKTNACGHPTGILGDGFNNLINLSFHRAGQASSITGSYSDCWYSSLANSWAGGTSSRFSITHPDTASENLFKESLITPGTLWRWKQDPDGIIYVTYSPEGHSTYHNYAYPCAGQSCFCETMDSHHRSANNRRQRFRFRGEVFLDPTGVAPVGGMLGSGEHGYMPTNDPRFVCIDVSDTLICFPHLMWSGGGAPANPTIGGVAFTVGDDPLLCDLADNCTYQVDFNPQRRAPGIRSDGVPTGYELTPSKIVGDVGEFAGSVTWEIVEAASLEDEQLAPINPAVWETEPKEDVGLDIYHEIGQVYPTVINEKTNEQYIPIGCTVECFRPGTGTIILGVAAAQPIRVAGHDDNDIFLVDSTGAPWINNTAIPLSHILTGDALIFRRADGSATTADVSNTNSGGAVGVGDRYTLFSSVWGQTMRLPWFNCYSFGNGIESDRVRDDFNQVTIDNGPKASTTLAEPYLEERRSSGFIWSGIYNSISGVNNLNQFIQAEKITKDLNPTYGTIQKLFSRNTDLVTFCEDKVLKVQANKDALFNADGSSNVTATDKVLGQTIPFAGEYGISKNPESFANEAYRLYFSDVSRGAALRLSQNGITPISEAGMQDWFSDELPKANVVLGTFDDRKQEYNITLKSRYMAQHTLSFSEISKGWTSFKSFIPEEGRSFNNNYYTFSGGDLYRHHTNPTRNNFYSDQFDSSVNILFNDIPGSVKSFNTLNYEGTQSRITLDLNLKDPEYHNNIAKDGWYVKSIYTNLQEINEDIEFKSKEGKWFAQIKGEATDLGNLDTREFSVQGIDELVMLGGDISWDCIPDSQTDDCDSFTHIGDFSDTDPVVNWNAILEEASQNYATSILLELTACIRSTTVPADHDCNCPDNHSKIIVPGVQLTMMCDQSTASVISVNPLNLSVSSGPLDSWQDFITNVVIAIGNYTPGTGDPTPADIMFALGIVSATGVVLFPSWLTLQSNLDAYLGQCAGLGTIETNYCTCTGIPCTCYPVVGSSGAYPTQPHCLFYCCGIGDICDFLPIVDTALAYTVNAMNSFEQNLIGATSTCTGCPVNGLWPNNETAIEAIVSTYGIDQDMRLYKFNKGYISSSGPANLGTYHSVETSHDDLDGFLYGGIKTWFYKWRDYIDAAHGALITIGDTAGALLLIDINKANTVNQVSSATINGVWESNGYNIDSAHVTQVIYQSFSQYGTGPNSGNYCVEDVANQSDCNKTKAPQCGEELITPS